MMSTKVDGHPSKDSVVSDTLVSVIIPVHNRERYIRDALDSVLAQSYPHIEVIVVDDGSTDGTAQILQSYADRVTVLTQKNLGPSAARNAGIQQAVGTVLGFLDSDDMWPENRVRALLPFLKESRGVVRGLTQYIGPEGQCVSEYHVVSTNVGACLYNQSVFDAVGLFDEEMTYAEDLDWGMRARELGYDELQTNIPALQHRKHSSNLTNTYEKVHQGKIRAFEKKVQRARERNQ